jgi:hypothetical protein
MLDNEFYPTSDEIIQLMVDPHFHDGSYSVKLNYKGFIFDPNGGSGKILDYLKDELGVNKNDIFTAEINPDLLLILQGKGYKVVAKDFLEYDEPLTFGFIIMNPPFSQGDKHVLTRREREIPLAARHWGMKANQCTALYLPTLSRIQYNDKKEVDQCDIKPSR